MLMSGQPAEMMDRSASPPSASPDSSAFGELRSALKGFILGRVRDAAVADDLVQETLLKMSRHAESLRESDRLEAWVFRIARNVVADHFRGEKPTVPFDEELHAADPDPPESSGEARLRERLSRYVRSVVEGLPEIYRDALMAVEFDGVPQVKLAGRLGLSVSAAKSRVRRARLMVKEEMERCCRWEFDRYGTAIDAVPRGRACGGGCGCE